MRSKLVEAVRAKIGDGSYENDLKLGVATDRLLDALKGKPRMKKNETTGNVTVRFSNPEEYLQELDVACQEGDVFGHVVRVANRVEPIVVTSGVMADLRVVSTFMTNDRVIVKLDHYVNQIWAKSDPNEPDPPAVKYANTLVERIKTHAAEKGLKCRGGCYE